MELAMMTERFQAAVDRVAQLPEKTQDRIALEIERALEIEQARERLAHLDGGMKFQVPLRAEELPRTTVTPLKRAGKL
jgi:hypothetical protein